MSKIAKIAAREILDSRGEPTIEVDVVTDDGFFDRASVPSGASVGQYEALELRDNDPHRYMGKGILKAIYNVENIIQPKLLGKDPSNQIDIDRDLIYLDNTKNKSKLGANSILGTSLACARAGSIAYRYPLYQYLTRLSRPQPEIFNLPVPFMLMIEGGLHGGYNLDFQEYMIVPLGASNFREALRWGAEIYHTLKKILEENKYTANIGDEGGYTPKLKTNEDAVAMISKAISAAGFVPGKDIFIGLDVAASELYKEEKYHLKIEDKKYNSKEMINYLRNLVEKYPIYSIEDGLSDDDWDGWSKLTNDIGTKVKIVGDDIFVTNIERLNQGLEKKVANSVIIKPNQVGTLSETIRTVKLAQQSGYTIIISHRSGETEDTFISDLAIGVGAFGIKTGALCRSERIAKYNQILRIEEALEEKATYGHKTTRNFNYS